MSTSSPSYPQSSPSKPYTESIKGNAQLFTLTAKKEMEIVPALRVLQADIRERWKQGTAPSHILLGFGELEDVPPLAARILSEFRADLAAQAKLFILWGGKTTQIQRSLGQQGIKRVISYAESAAEALFLLGIAQNAGEISEELLERLQRIAAFQPFLQGTLDYFGKHYQRAFTPGEMFIKTRLGNSWLSEIGVKIPVEIRNFTGKMVLSFPNSSIERLRGTVPAEEALKLWGISIYESVRAALLKENRKLKGAPILEFLRPEGYLQFDRECVPRVVIPLVHSEGDCFVEIEGG